MVRVAATEFSKNFGMYREIVQREPVEVTSHDRVTGYFLSAQEYQEYKRLKALQAQAFAVEELSQATIQAIANAQMDVKHLHLNALMG